MSATRWDGIVKQLESHDMKFDAGLSDVEITTAERCFGFRFPPDLRELFDLPRQGILFDVEHNGFWLEEWGPVPGSLQEALRAASDLVQAAPKLIPIYIHRMMPEEPLSAGNPVFSVHQTDIIYYGFDLADYLRHEFALDGREAWPAEMRPIRFWDIGRFQDVRWSQGPCVFDNSRGLLP